MIYDEENKSCIVYEEEWLKNGDTQRSVSFYDNHPCCEGGVVIKEWLEPILPTKKAMPAANQLQALFFASFYSSSSYSKSSRSSTSSKSSSS